MASGDGTTASHVGEKVVERRRQLSTVEGVDEQRRIPILPPRPDAEEAMQLFVDGLAPVERHLLQPPQRRELTLLPDDRLDAMRADSFCRPTGKDTTAA